MKASNFLFLTSNNIKYTTEFTFHYNNLIFPRHFLLLKCNVKLASLLFQEVLSWCLATILFFFCLSGFLSSYLSLFSMILSLNYQGLAHQPLCCLNTFQMDIGSLVYDTATITSRRVNPLSVPLFICHTCCHNFPKWDPGLKSPSFSHPTGILRVIKFFSAQIIPMKKRTS